MSIYLKFDRLGLGNFRRTRDVKLQAHFLDEHGNSYHWVPCWKDVVELLEKASNVEGFNKPGSEWLAEFADAVKNVLVNAERNLVSARKIYGTIDSVRDGRIVVVPLHFDGDAWHFYTHVDKRDAVSAPPAFPIDADWCMRHLNQAADVLIANGWIVRVDLREIET